MQTFTGMIAALNRFVSRSADRCRPFYQLLKKWKGFQWTKECDIAFRDLKSYLVSPPILSRPKPKEDLYMYLVVSDHAVSYVLIRQQEGIRRPIYYLSKTLVDAKTRYFLLEKMELALMHARRKLPHYFQAHTVWVLTEYPLQSLLKRSNFIGRIAKWGTRLGTFDIWYKLRNSIKGQVLVDFVAEFTPTPRAFVGICQVMVKWWQVYMDDAPNARWLRVGIVMVSSKGLRLLDSE